ncbi:MAG: epoxyqueuosine reductase QueH [Oscillospiraceae bacterium]
MKQNFQQETDKITKALGGERPRLLLQCCCGPCSSYVLEYLTEFFDVTVLFYNPNIQPREEFEKRQSTLCELLAVYGGTVALQTCDYDGESFDEASRGLENEREGGARCTECFRLRLRETARRAACGGFDFFCTTLSVSPHKDAERINAIGQELENEFSVRWLPSDFKKREGYKRSIERSRELLLYRQSYCGCLFSLAEAQKMKG